MKIYISAQALQKLEMETRLAAFMGDTIEHMLKLYLIPSHSARNHWKQEVYAFVHSVEKLKNTKKFPTANQIFEWTYKKVEDTLSDNNKMNRMIIDICNSYNADALNDAFDVVRDFDIKCKNYFLWTAEELSKTGFLFRSDVYEKLDELFS